MTPFDWNPYLVGGGTRPDAMSGLDQQFGGSLAALFQSAPPEVQENLRITSAYRSPEVQERLYADALEKYGSEQEARRWVAPPGNSQHNHGSAVDFKFLDPSAQSWVHENAGQFGLNFPMEHEPWHVEPVGARGGESGPKLSFGADVPAAPQSGMESMFGAGAALPWSEGSAAQSNPFSKPASQSSERRSDREADERIRRSELAKLIRY